MQWRGSRVFLQEHPGNLLGRSRNGLGPSGSVPDAQGTFPELQSRRIEHRGSAGDDPGAIGGSNSLDCGRKESRGERP